MNDTLLEYLPILVIGFVALIVAVVLLRRWFVNVGAREIAIKERRYFGAKMPPGRVVATEGEVGIQADVLKPGLHLIKWPFEKVVRKVPLIEIGADELGIVEAVDGEPMPPGRIFAPDRAQNAHNNFQDPIAFIKQGGVKGIQLRTLPPGLWPIHPYLFRVSVSKMTVIPPGKVGIVTASDGDQLDSGRLHGKAIEGHRNYQDAEQFIANGGQKGPQVEILTPGTYRILTQSLPIEGGDPKPGLFFVRLYDATVINENQIGLVEALDGAPLDPRDYVATPVEGHDNFQDCNEFISRGGQRGPQKDILLPGTYYINPLVFKAHPRVGEGGEAGRGGRHRLERRQRPRRGHPPRDGEQGARAPRTRGAATRSTKAAARLDKLEGENRRLNEIQEDLHRQRPGRPAPRSGRARGLRRPRRLPRHPGDGRRPRQVLHQHAGDVAHRHPDHEHDGRVDGRGRRQHLRPVRGHLEGRLHDEARSPRRLPRQAGGRALHGRQDRQSPTSSSRT